MSPTAMPAEEASNAFAAPVAELLRRLPACDDCDIEDLCNVLAERVQQLSPSEVPQLFEALLAALHTRLGTGLRHSHLAVLEEVCASWKDVRLVPQDGLKTLLKLMLQSEAPLSSQLPRAKSSPDLLRRMQSPGRHRRPAAVDEPAGLPAGDARLLQMLLRLAGLGEGGADPRRAAQRSASRTRRRRGRSFGSRCCSAERPRSIALSSRGTCPLASPTVTNGTAALSIADSSEAISWASRVQSLERDCAEASFPQHCVFDMAEDDSSAGSRGSSRTAASLDWCFDALDIASSRSNGRRERCLALTPRAKRACQRYRGKSLPAELRAAPIDAVAVGGEMCQQDLGHCMQAQHMLSQQFNQLRNNQIVCLQAAQETASLVVEMNRHVEAERVARLAEIQERTALRAELRTVCAQVEALARGQQELQQCMMMMCARMGPVQQQPPAEQLKPAPQQQMLEAAEEEEEYIESSHQCPTPSGRRTVSVHGKAAAAQPQRSGADSPAEPAPAPRAIHVHAAPAPCRARPREPVAVGGARVAPRRAEEPRPVERALRRPAAEAHPRAFI